MEQKKIAKAHNFFFLDNFKKRFAPLFLESLIFFDRFRPEIVEIIITWDTLYNEICILTDILKPRSNTEVNNKLESSQHLESF